MQTRSSPRRSEPASLPLWVHIIMWLTWLFGVVMVCLTAFFFGLAVIGNHPVLAVLYGVLAIWMMGTLWESAALWKMIMEGR